MIRHLVFLRFLPSVTVGERDGLFTDLAKLKRAIPGVLAFGVRPNVSPETPVVRGFTWMFWFDFDDAATRDVYLDHPEHRAVGARIVEATGGPEGVFVCDIEMEDNA